MKKVITTCLVVVLFGVGYVKADTWTTIDYPGATSTVTYGIDGRNIVGSYNNGNGFLYNGTTWTTLAYPGATGTSPYGISGNNIVGECSLNNDERSFLYNGTNWTTLFDYPGASWTWAKGMSGNNIAGYYTDSSGLAHGFTYDGTNYAALNYPGAMQTFVYGISGNNIIGDYDSGGTDHGFLYDGTNWTVLPFSPGGIDGSNVVGDNFLYNVTTGKLTTLNMAEPWIWAEGISGNSIVGIYTDSSNNEHGFLYTVPEPASLLLLGLGGLLCSEKSPNPTSPTRLIFRGRHFCPAFFLLTYPDEQSCSNFNISLAPPFLILYNSLNWVNLKLLDI